MRGDCNLDNVIDSLDSQAVADHAVGLTPITGPRRMACDVDRSGTINVLDALMIAQYYVGLNPSGFNPGAADVDCSNINAVSATKLAT